MRLIVTGEFAKSFARPSAPVLFFKSHIKQFTRKDGAIVKEHDDKRQKKMQAPASARPAAGDPEEVRGAAHGYGTHNIEEGDTVHFKAGEFQGKGAVKSVGKDGARIEDAEGRAHNVLWHEVTGFKAERGGGGDKKPPEGGGKQGEGSEDRPKKDGEQSKSNVVDFKSSLAKAEDIARALFDTSEIEQLPKKVDQPENLDSWEKIKRAAPEALKQLTGMLNKVAGALSLEKGRRPLSLKFAQHEENAKAQEENREPEHLNEEDYMSPALWNDPRGFLFIGPLKKQDRAQAKVTADYTDEETGREDWRKLRDMVRATIAVPAVTQIPKVLAEMKKAGIKLAQQPKNNLLGDGIGGSGYRDLNLIVQMPNGMMCELQIHCKPMTEAKERGHEHYADNAAIERKYPNKRRDLSAWSDEDKEKFDKNTKTMKALYDEAWEKSIGGGVPDDGKDGPVLHKAIPRTIIVLWKRRA